MLGFLAVDLHVSEFCVREQDTVVQNCRADTGAEGQEDDHSVGVGCCAEPILGDACGVGIVEDRDVSCIERRREQARASAPIHEESMLAAVRATPPVTTLGRVIPTGPSHPACSMISATVAATASGVDGCGVRILIRSPINWPVDRSTRPPFTPLPPTSTPNPVSAESAGARGGSCVMWCSLSGSVHSTGRSAATPVGQR